MAEKPRTYPQQIQDLKSQLADRDAIIASLQEQLGDTVPQLQAEVQQLRDQVTTESNADRLVSVSDRAKMNDLVQRAESAEQRLKAVNQANAVLQADIERMLAGADHSVELQRELASKQQHLENARAQVHQANQNMLDVQRIANDRVNDAQREVESMSAELKSLRLTAKHYSDNFAEFRESASNTITSLNARLEAAQLTIAELTARNQENYQIITRFQEILEQVPDTRAQLAALIDRAQIAESTV